MLAEQHNRKCHGIPWGASLSHNIIHIRDEFFVFVQILLFGAVFMALFTASVAQARPVPLAEEEGCELWVGNASGNDPSVLVELRICPDGDGVVGDLQWSSERSGWNRRQVRGEWETSDRLRFRDVRLVENRPRPRWRFCLIDHYVLRRNGPDRLVGSYHSQACADRAELNLRRRSDVERGASPPAGGTAPQGGGAPAEHPGPVDSPSDPAVPNVEEPTSRRSGPLGLCAVVPGSMATPRGGGLLLLLMGLCGVLRVRCRCIGR